MASWLMLQAWGELLFIDLVALRGFEATRRVVKATRLGNGRPSSERMLSAVLRAVSTASLLYFKKAYCLQRSAVITRMLRRYGIPAELVVGYRQPPLEGHAWVEVRGTAVADIRGDLGFFCVLDRW